LLIFRRFEPAYPAVLQKPCFACPVVSMHFRSIRVIAALALAALSLVAQPASAQTRPPARTAQRAPVDKDSQLPVAGPTKEKAAVKGAADAAPVPAGKAATGAAPKGSVKILTPQAPFVLTESQQKLLDSILANWEQHSSKVNTFKCKFTRWDYDKAYGRKSDGLKAEGAGTIKYKSPDRGDYSVTELREYVEGKVDFVPRTDGLDHWVCTGESIFEFVPDKKQLIERKLPPDMRGKAIADGPLPFIFSAKADQLKQRYWMRDITPSKFVGKEIWLEAIPKRQQDAANFQRATIILTDPDFVPYALQIFLPDGKNNTAYEFKDPVTNDPLSFVKLDFTRPMTPIGWKKIVEDDSSNAPASTPPPTGDQGQAKRPAPATKRK
jgi:TIGR03009 family protein